MDGREDISDWDEANESHIGAHGVGREGVEEALLDTDQVSSDAYDIVTPFGKEERESVIGKAEGGSILFVVYTWRGGKVRPISAREANEMEKRRYRKR
jgi:uncharacterized protein